MVSKEVEEVTHFRPISQPQLWFLQCESREAGFGGSSYCGKTLLAVIDALRQVEHPEHFGLLFRRYEDELGGMIEYARKYYPSLGGKESDEGKKWKFPSGSNIRFGGMDLPDSWMKYGGRNITYAYWDELPSFKEKQYTGLGPWIRSPDSRLKAYRRWSGNPWPDIRGDGIEWIMERFNIPSNERITRPIVTLLPGGLERVFIPATYRDNKAIAPEEIERWKAQLWEDIGRDNPDQYDAYINGIWGASPGLFFNKFNMKVHVLSPDEMRNRIGEEKLVKRAAGMDYGSGTTTPTVLLWGCRTATNVCYIEGEYAKANYPIELHAVEIKKLAPQWPLDIFADGTMWKGSNRYAKVGENRKTATDFLDNGVRLINAGNDARYSIEQGHRLIRDALYYDASKGFEPTLFISSRALGLINDLKTAQKDPTYPDKLANDGDFHRLAALRYFMLNVSRPRLKPVTEESKYNTGGWLRERVRKRAATAKPTRTRL